MVLDNNIKLLKLKIELEKIKLEKNNIKYDIQFDKYLENKHKFGILESELNIELEKINEEKRIYISDKCMYNCIINEINNKTRDVDDIPELFKIKFIIFQKLKLDFSNLVETDEYNKYIELKQIINIDNIETNTKYDNMFTNNIIYKKLYNDLKKSKFD